MRVRTPSPFIGNRGGSAIHQRQEIMNRQGSSLLPPRLADIGRHWQLHLRKKNLGLQKMWPALRHMSKIPRGPCRAGHVGVRRSVVSIRHRADGHMAVRNPEIRYYSVSHIFPATLTHQTSNLFTPSNT